MEKINWDLIKTLVILRGELCKLGKKHSYLLALVELAVYQAIHGEEDIRV